MQWAPERDAIKKQTKKVKKKKKKAQRREMRTHLILGHEVAGEVDGGAALHLELSVPKEGRGGEAADILGVVTPRG